MKLSLLFTTFLLSYVTPSAFAKTELEILRQRCAEQERQIRLLEEENLKLRLLGERYRPATATTTNNAPATPSTGASSSAAGTYTIKPGDSLERIARRHNTTTATLVRLNNIKDPLKIQPGQTIQLPQVATAPTPATTVSAPPSPTPKATVTGTHTVAPGETLYSIGKKRGLSVNQLLAANPGINPNALRPGQRLQLGAANAPATAAKPPVTSTPKPTPPAPSPAPSRNLAPPPSIPISTPTPLPPVPNQTKPAEASGSKLVKVATVTTFGEFASAHGTTVERLNELNNLDLTRSTVLAIGSELYAPAQP